MRFGTWRRARWLFSGALGVIGLMMFVPPFLVEHTSIFNAATKQRFLIQITCEDGTRCERFSDESHPVVDLESTSEELVLVVWVEKRPIIKLSQGSNVIKLRKWDPTLHFEVMDKQRNFLRAYVVYGGATIDSSRDPIFLDMPQTILSARLTVSFAVALALLLVLFHLSRRPIREYLGKSDSPPISFLYLIGLGASITPSPEQDDFVATWIAEITETEGWERIRFTVSLLRVGPGIYYDAKRTQIARRMKFHNQDH
jgi:hypothetical protein